MKQKATRVKHTNAHKVKPKLPKVADIQPDLKPMPPISRPPQPKPEPEPVPKPESKSEPKYTQADWEKEVAEHVPPGRSIPDWLAAKAPTG